MMENITCQMDCHACTLQEGTSAKNACATLLMPAMLNRHYVLMSEIKTKLEEIKNLNPLLEVNEVKLPKKLKNKEEND